MVSTLVLFFLLASCTVDEDGGIDRGNHLVGGSGGSGEAIEEQRFEQEQAMRRARGITQVCNRGFISFGTRISMHTGYMEHGNAGQVGNIARRGH